MRNYLPIQPFLASPPTIVSRKHASVPVQPVFSILIPSWNNLEFLQACVASLKKNSRYNHQIILHLNEADDGSRAWAEEQKLDYTWSANNIGICYAMNLARQLANSEYIVYFNDDMYACPDWDFWLHEEIKIVGSPFFFLSSTMIEPRASGNSCVLAPYDFGDHPQRFDEAGLLSSYHLPTIEDWNGATWPPSVVSAQLWDMVGGYSIEFSPGMYSDPDFSMKLWQAGVRYFKGISRSRVYHFMSKSTAKLNKKKVNGSKIFLNKWGMSANTFSWYYLQRGKPIKQNTTLELPLNNFRLKIRLLLNDFKRRLS